MKKLLTAAACGFLFCVGPAVAQSPRLVQRPVPSPTKQEHTEPQKTSSVGSQSMSEMTPQMWLYMQERDRHDDPKAAVRRKAEYRTAQRQRRIAAREWFGYSNARPAANSDPWMAGYSARWSANSPMRPDQWIGNGRTPLRR